MKNKLISFDFDDTLETPTMRALASWYIAEGYDVYVTTARFMLEEDNAKYYSDWIKDGRACNTDVYKVCDEVGIPHDNVRFCGYTSKVEYLEGFSIHYDDSDKHIHQILKSEKTNCIPIKFS